MPDSPVSVLVVADDQAIAGRLSDCISRRDNRLVCLPAGADAVAAASTRSFDVVLIGFESPSAPNIQFVKQLKTQASNTEVIVVFDAPCGDDAASDLWTLADIVAPFDPRQLLAAVDGTLEPRRATLHNRRLLWELQVINETSEVISRSLELDDVLAGALQRLVPALDAVGGTIRLRDQLTGHYDVKALVGPVEVQKLLHRADSDLPRPSDEVITTRAAVVFEDLARFLPDDRRDTLPVRSSICVPMFGGDELIGTLSVSAAKPFRFGIADEHLLSIVAGQIAVAVQNASLHDSVRRGKREWEQTFDAISDPIAVFDGRGILLRGNTALATILGTKVTGIRHRTCQDVGFCGGKCPHCAVGDALLRGVAGRAEITLPNGQIFSVTTFPVAGGAEGASVVQVAKNVTEEIRSARRLRQMSEELGVANARLTATLDQLKSTQAQLLQAEKISAIGQLVAGVAHELNNPLTSVIGYAQLLEEELVETPSLEALRPPADMAKDLRRIAEESERAARIVRNLLAFARRQTAARAPQDVADLVGRVLSLRTYELRLNGIELRTELEVGLPPVFADSGQLQQALLNLILNAEQAMRGQSARRLTVAARYDESAASVELSVADTGHGIDHLNLSRIFDPFFTTRDVGEGTGLGLSICYGIIRDHGGQISVESRPQVGTRFSILLPARVDASANDSEAILVAHADQGDRDFLAAALGAWGLPVAVVNADEALARYRRGRLQTVIVDRAIVAADLTGWTAARAADTRRVPLILMSMTAEDADIERFGLEQASAILAPPFQLRALRSAVRAVAKEYA